MTKRIIKEQYFKDRQEQARIKTAIVSALEPGWYFGNIVQALLELALEYSRMERHDDWYYKDGEK